MDFFHMGGYGHYIWFAYGIVVVILIAHALISRRRWRKWLQLTMMRNETTS